MTQLTKPSPGEEAKPSHFLRQIIEADLTRGTYARRRWAGSPGDQAHHAESALDTARIRTRFPPEPNGYLHIGHAKSICLNFGLARDYGGVCHMRFDDTNPEKENIEYVNSIMDAVRWLGFHWNGEVDAPPYQASDYFGFMHRAAVYLIEQGLAYVDEQSAEQIRLNRGDFGKPGVNSPFRDRPIQDNLLRFEAMREGKLPDGSAVLRAKIDMASPNINLRDPAIYRIRHATHHHTGDQWCIYPMYTFAHPIEDALENITHSICTLEFEDQRPFYDWLLGHLAAGGLIQSPPPKQYEFARLNLTYVVTSKRKLAQLVSDGHVNGWDDPRMPTIVGLRRRGYTPESLHLFAERIGVSKSDSWIDYSTLEACLRDDLENKAPRAMAVLDPIKLVLTNWEEAFGPGHLEPCQLPRLPHAHDPCHAEDMRHFTLGKEVWIEREDFSAVPPKGYKRLSPPQTLADGSTTEGAIVRLKGGYVVQCTGFLQNEQGDITEVHATVFAHTKSGSEGADSVKTKGVITWVGVADGLQAEIRLYDRLFTEAHPDAGGRDFLTVLNPHSLQIKQGFVEPSLRHALPGESFQFERIGYVVTDRLDHQPQRPVFNLAVGLKDSWGK